MNGPTAVDRIAAAVFQREADMLATGRRPEQFRLCPADWDAVMAATEPRVPVIRFVIAGHEPMTSDPMLLGYPLVVDPDAPRLLDPERP